MTKVIAIANQKGGVGKTSTTVNLGAGLVRQGYAVLAIDFDPQANLTMALGFKSPDDMEYTASNVLAKAMDEEPIDPSKGILTTAEGVDLMPSSIQLSRFELALVNEMNRESMLRQFVDAVKPNYDYILIDCAPSLNVLALNALTAADSVLIPTQPEFFSNAGLQMLLSTVSKVRKKINPSLNIEGVLVTMMDKRPNFTKELVSQLREAYGGTIKVFDTEIPKLNNRKTTFDAACRAMLFDICEKHGLHLDHEPEYGGRKYLEKQDYILMKQREKIAAQDQTISAKEAELQAITVRIEDTEAFVDEVAETAYEKAVEAVTRTVQDHSFIDAIAPSSMSIERDHIRIGDKYARVLFLKEYPSFLKDSMVREICEMQRNMMFSIDIIPVPTEEAVKEVERKLLGTESDITKWQQQQNKNNNFSAVVPYSLEQQRKESTEYLNDLTNRDQRMMFVTVTAVHMADTLEELDADTEAFLSIGRKHLCDFEKLTYQQLQGLITVLPYGLRKINALRTLTTESTAVLMPFSAQEISYEDGFYCGQNAISRNQIFVNREKLLNGNGFYLGTSGSGKSFFAKKELAWIILMGLADVIVMDPESEYGHLIKALGGEVIRIAADSKTHINAMDMDANYSDSDNPLKLKADLQMAPCSTIPSNQ